MSLILKLTKMSKSHKIVEFNFSLKIKTGLFITAGGFEDRSIAFSNKLKISNTSIEQCLILRYENQYNANDPNFLKLNAKLIQLTKRIPEVINVNGDSPIYGFTNIKSRISEYAKSLINKKAIIDISGMPHLFALSCIHSCYLNNLKIEIIYSEAKSYFPKQNEQKTILSAWKNDKYNIVQKYLQSAALKAVHIIPEFSGIFRPGRQTCLIIFVGFEPNRIEGLVDEYAPNRLIVLFGKSPHTKFEWRTNFSKKLHENLFAKWHVREDNVSTLDVREIILKLESEYNVIHEQFDIAIAPQCSKMQAIATYLFWQKHPESQLVFTTPVRFNPERYSKGSGKIFLFKL